MNIVGRVRQLNEDSFDRCTEAEIKLEIGRTTCPTEVNIGGHF